MASTNDKDLLPEFESIKDDKEEIFWTGKPKFIPFIFTGVLSGLVIIVFAIIWVLTAKNWNTLNNNNSSSYFWLFGLIPLIAGLFTFLKKYFPFQTPLIHIQTKE